MLLLVPGGRASVAKSHSAILRSEDSTNDVLFVLFIPNKDKKGKELKDQELWADAAGELLTKLFGGATEMPPAKGKWYNEDDDEIITEGPILIHSYARAEHANDEERIQKLAEFLHRLGRETNQG